MPPVLLLPLLSVRLRSFFFFFIIPSHPELYTLSLHDALPIRHVPRVLLSDGTEPEAQATSNVAVDGRSEEHTSELSHRCISYAVFCLKKKKEEPDPGRAGGEIELHLPATEAEPPYRLSTTHAALSTRVLLVRIY